MKKTMCAFRLPSTLLFLQSLLVGCGIFPESFRSVPRSYSVSVSGQALTDASGSHVIVEPSSLQSVFNGSPSEFLVAAEKGYTLSNEVGGTCPTGTWSGNSYTTGIILGDCTVIFSATINSYNVTSIGNHVSLSSTTPSAVNFGSTKTFSVVADTGYTNDLAVGGNCPAGSWNGADYTTGPISGDCHVIFNATLNNYTASSSGSNVTISPAGAQTVSHGAVASYSISPNTGHTLTNTVGGSCPAGSWSGAIYTTGAIVGDCSVLFSATLNAYAVNANGTHVSLSSATPVLVNHGTTKTFSVVADTGYTRNSAVGGNCPAGSWNGNQYTTGPITSPCTVIFDATINTYVANATGSNVTIAPGSSQTATYGSSVSFSVSTSTGYTLSSFVGGSCPAGSWSGANYTTGPLTGDCSIVFSAILNTYTLSATGSHVSITPGAGYPYANHGSTFAFFVTEDAGYIRSNTVGGTCPAGSWAGSLYTTGAITSDCSVSFTAQFNYCDAGTLNDTCRIWTVKQIPPNEILSGTGNLWIQPGGSLTVSPSLDGGIPTRFTVIVGGYVNLEAPNAIAANIQLTSNTLTIQPGASINADGKGYAGGTPTTVSGQGPGGGLAYTNISGGGGGYGGAGGDGSLHYAIGGSPYGGANKSQPTEFGSGGGYGGNPGTNGGAGGGAVEIHVTGVFTHGGSISANGIQGAINLNSGGGGGSGGSIWVSVGSFNGAGQILAKGGSAGGGTYPENYGGGGAGGRIAIYSGDPFRGTLSVAGGGGFASGGTGSFYMDQNSLNSSTSFCDVGSSPNTNCIVTGPIPLSEENSFNVPGDLTLGNGGYFYTPDNGKPTLQIGGTFNVANAGTSLMGRTGNFASLSAANFILSGVFDGDINSLISDTIVVAGSYSGNLRNVMANSFVITATGQVRADGRGYKGGTVSSSNGQGSGGGLLNGFGSGGGAGFGGSGGQGTASSGGASYGTPNWDQATAQMGSGGAWANWGWGLKGGAGGGIIFIQAANFTNNGLLSANGQNGGGTSGPDFYNYGTGAGSGGSIGISAATLNGTGTISANGGNGGPGGGPATFNGGGGGGGRVSLGGMTYPGTVSVVGGSGAFAGSSGTIY